MVETTDIEANRIKPEDYIEDKAGYIMVPGFGRRERMLIPALGGEAFSCK